MKIRSIRLFNHNQFKDFTLDLVYPLGHEKAGMPLEKVCIIGQSGTGKTTLLNFMSNLLKTKGRIENLKYHAAFDINNQVLLVNKDLGIVPIVSVSSRTGSGTRGLPGSEGISFLSKSFSTPNILSMYLPADFLSNNKDDSEGLIDDGRNFYDFKDVNIRKIWYRILDEIKENQRTELDLRAQIADIYSISNKHPDEMDKETEPIREKLRLLLSEDTNPLKKIANTYLDVILSHFNLKVDTDFSISENLDKVDYIRIKDNKGNVIPNGLLSTGTSQFLLSSLPFYLLKPRDAVVLFDEPERSLYPNIQKLLVEHYSKFAPDCQFIYATHSPIIASCFDPWEVIELRFNDEGFIEQKPYCVGEKHVDNYTVHPKYLTYELILKEVFDVPETEGDDRAEKLTELAMYDDQLKTFKKNDDNSSDAFKAALDKYLKLAELLSFPKQHN